MRLTLRNYKQENTTNPTCRGAVDGAIPVFNRCTGIAQCSDLAPRLLHSLVHQAVTSVTRAFTEHITTRSSQHIETRFISSQAIEQMLRATEFSTLSSCVWRSK